MSLRKDMTINERVFCQDINNGPSIVTYHFYQFIHIMLSMDMWVISEFTGSFQVNWEYPTMDVTDRETHVCKLNKALYGLKQEPMTWYDKINRFMMILGYTKSK